MVLHVNCGRLHVVHVLAGVCSSGAVQTIKGGGDGGGDGDGDGFGQMHFAALCEVKQTAAQAGR